MKRKASLLGVPARGAQINVRAEQVAVGALAMKGRFAAHAAQEAAPACMAAALGAPCRLRPGLDRASCATATGECHRPWRQSVRLLYRRRPGRRANSMTACSKSGTQVVVRDVELERLVRCRTVTQRKACVELRGQHAAESRDVQGVAPCCGHAMCDALHAQRTAAKYGTVPHTSHSASFASTEGSGASATLCCRSHLRKCSCSCCRSRGTNLSTLTCLRYFSAAHSPWQLPQARHAQPVEHAEGFEAAAVLWRLD